MHIRLQSLGYAPVLLTADFSKKKKQKKKTLNIVTILYHVSGDKATSTRIWEQMYYMSRLYFKYVEEIPSSWPLQG